jgi:YidC/Oxa1 family membrane protein insertase
MISQIFNITLYNPLFNALLFLYKNIPGQDMGLAIIILTTIIRFILFPLSRSAVKSQKSLQEMNPKLKEIKEKYKNDREKMAQELMKFYKEHKINPLSSCLPFLIQFPILIALYRVLIGGLNFDAQSGILVADQLKHIYPPLRDFFLTHPINPYFLGIINLSKSGNIVLALLAGLLQYWQSKMLMVKKTPPKISGAKDEALTAALSKQMTYFFPIMIVFLGISFPAGLTLYWVISTLFSIGQQYLVLKKT